MTDLNHEAQASLLSELLLYHAVLGRGYISPFPATKGLVFSSALPYEALSVLASAESGFRRWHDGKLEDDRKQLQLLESQPQEIVGLTHGDKFAAKKLKEKLSRRPHITWKEDQVTKSTLVELMKTHYYGAMTYLDPVGARLAASLCHAVRLASDLGWVTLTEGTTDETLIRATASGGACIHSLTGSDAIFNHFCSCKEPHLAKLLERIKETPSGQVGIGSTIAIPGRAHGFSGVSSDVLFSLAQRVFALGDSDPEHRVKVLFDGSSRSEWVRFLEWGLPDILGETPPAWQWKLSLTAPAAPRTAVLFGARAAMVMAFLQLAEAQPDGPIRAVELRADHLESAKTMAKLIYRASSGQIGYEQRIKNLKPAVENFITPQRLSIAKTAITEAIEKSESRRISRTKIRREVPGATLGLLDELVKAGEFIELSGADQCGMGKTSKAYVLPVDAPPCDELDAVDEYQEADEDFRRHPDSFSEAEAMTLARRIRERAAAIYAEHRLPVVPLSRLTRAERRMLPRILERFPKSFVLRGAAVGYDEPAMLVNDDDVPIDKSGANLWVRYKPDGSDFCDWDTAGLLKLDNHWGRATAAPAETIP